MNKSKSKAESRKQLTKKYIKDNLEEILLEMSNKGPIHGYEIIRTFKKAGAFFSPSEIYPALWQLEKEGYLRSEKQYPDEGKPKRVYYPVPKTHERLEEIKNVKSRLSITINIPPSIEVKSSIS
jgi:DNA-binding PadR family transcriptional regulator